MEEDDECGEITASQEQIFLNAPFLDPNPNPPVAPLLSSSSDDDDDDDAHGDSRKRPRSDERLGLGDSSRRRKPDQSLETLQDIFGNSSAAASGSASGTRKPASSIPSKLPSEGVVNARSGSEASAGAYPANLGDAVEMLSGSEELDDKLAGMDILEVLAMRGIVIPNPSWWPPGGYPDP